MQARYIRLDRIGLLTKRVQWLLETTIAIHRVLSLHELLELLLEAIVLLFRLPFGNVVDFHGVIRRLGWLLVVLRGLETRVVLRWLVSHAIFW